MEIDDFNIFNSLYFYKVSKSEVLHYIADTDYLAFRNLCLLEQPAFSLILFAGQQAIEKSLKSIILLHGGKTNRLNHDLLKLYSEAKKLASSLETESTKLYDELIKTFNDAEHGRYASTNINVDKKLHHKLDVFYLNHLRKIYYKDYSHLRQFINPDNFQEILNHKHLFPNSFHALTYDNNALGYSLQNQITTIRSINFKLKPTIILGENECKNKGKLEEKIGLKISNLEFNQTFLLNDEEKSLLNSKNLFSDLTNRRNSI